MNDRWDLRKDGSVEIYVDGTMENSQSGGAFSEAYIAQVIAHESGHGFGLAHIYGSTSSSEVMDYDFDFTGLEEEGFSSDPYPVVSFAISDDLPIVLPTGSLSSPVTYHNPTYHLYTHTTGQSVEGLIEGEYDIRDEISMGYFR